MSGTVVLRIGRAVSLPASTRVLWIVPLLGLALVASLAAALGLGSSPSGLGDLVRAATAPRADLDGAARMIADFRWPRAAAAVLAGAMMAASGYLLQVVARNGLADPGLLGLSDGAAVAVLGVGYLLVPLSPGATSWIALAGAMATALAVVGLGRRLLGGSGIILVGLAVGIVLGAVVEVILASVGAAEFSRILTWSRGALDAVDRGDLALLATWFAVLAPAGLAASRVLSPLLLGDEAARALGLPTRPAAVILIVLAATFAAPVVATAGPIAFVGLMSSFIARRLVAHRPTEVLIVAMLVGALIVLWADTLGRTLFAPLQISAGIMISVVGVAVFVLAARTDRNRQKREG